MTTAGMTVGRYHVERLIAHGGMGSVYLARDPAIDRRVVIKLLKEGFDDAAARERFTREARSAGRLQHPNIVTVFDFGEHEARPFIAMEYVEGETLAELIKRDRLLRISEKLAMLEDVCAGLHHAHGLGIVHRDIKPANVMRLDSGLVKILDFGVARGGAGPVTRAGDVVGTLNYMSPEQLVGEPVDHRTDVYAVGALAYELFTLRMAFPGSIDTGVLHRILNAGALPIADVIPGIDPDIATIVERAMARDVDARYQHLEAMRDAVATVRVRVLESGADVEPAVDANAETRVDSGRIASGPRLPSRRSSTVGRATRSAASLQTAQVQPPARTNSTLLLGVACAALAGALVATLVLRQPPAAAPPVERDETPNVEVSPPQPAPDTSSAAPNQLPADAAIARDEPARTARETATKRAAPRAPAPVEQPPPVAVQQPALAPTAVPPSSLPRPPSPPVPEAPARTPLPGSSPPAADPAPVAPPPVATAQPAAKVPEPGAVAGDVTLDSKASDLAAIRETLRRYASAYQSLNSAEVEKVMPALGDGQLRDLQRDFSSYRSYTVTMTDERIEVDGATATVACQVRRAFQTRNGVNGSNTVRSVFHLRRTGTGWTIARVESR